MSGEVTIHMNVNIGDTIFSRETILKAVEENMDSISRDETEASLLVVGPMAIVAYWEGEHIIVEKVIRSEEIEELIQ